MLTMVTSLCGSLRDCFLESLRSVYWFSSSLTCFYATTAHMPSWNHLFHTANEAKVCLGAEKAPPFQPVLGHFCTKVWFIVFTRAWPKYCLRNIVCWYWPIIETSVSVYMLFGIGWEETKNNAETDAWADFWFLHFQRLRFSALMSF